MLGPRRQARGEAGASQPGQHHTPGGTWNSGGGGGGAGVVLVVPVTR